MRRPPTPRHVPATPAAGAVRAALLALSPTDTAQARVEAISEGWSGVAEKRGTASRQRQQRRAMEAEGLARQAFRDRGYRVTQSHESRTAADFVATKIDDATPGPLSVHCQVKSLVGWEGTKIADAYARFMGWGAWRKDGPYTVATGAERQIWVREWGRGWVAVVTLAADGGFTVEGDRAEEARRAIEGRCARERANRQRERNETADEFASQVESGAPVLRRAIGQRAGRHLQGGIV